MNSPQLSVFFPAHNESKNIERLIAEAEAALKELKILYEIIIIDDGSTDNTAEIVQRLIDKYPHLRLIKHDQNRGYGAALKTGFLNALGEVVFFSDADGQFDLSDLKTAWRVLSETRADAVVGYRARRQDPLIRRLAGKTWTILINTLFQLHYRDIDCAFKMFRRSAVEVIEPRTLAMTGAMVSPEMLVRLDRRHCRVVEIPVTHRPRLYGRQSGISWRVVKRAINELIKFWKNERWRN